MNEEYGSFAALGTSAGRPPRKRSNLEKRRLQNRESQRTYREKQKRIKQNLKQASRSERSDRQVLDRPLQPKEPAPEPGGAHELELANTASQDLIEISNNDEDLTQTISEAPGEATGSWFSVAELDTNLLDEFTSTTRPFDMTWPTSQSNTTLAPPASTQLVNARQSFYDMPFFKSTTYFNDVPSFSASPNAPSHNASSYPASVNMNTELTIARTGMLSLLQVPDTAEHRDLLANALQQQHSIGSIFLAGLRSISNSVPAAEYLPDMHTNHLSLRQLSTMQAYLSNARTLLFDVPSLMHPLAPSPFHQPHIATVAAAEVYISTLPDSFPLHLRPSPAQVVHAHPPFLDLLPFPTLRERAITLASVIPPLIEMRELKADILNDGLVCWGGTKSGGQPWDMRTWEAARWFLRKWWMLVGSEGEEVREGARWWQQLRDEDPGTRFHEEV